MIDERKVEKNIEVLKDLWRYKETKYTEKEIRDSLEKGIESLENQKTGHWIEKNVNQDGTHNIYCSNCNNYQKFKGHANSYNARTKLKYCPYCGAKMTGE